MYHSQSSHSRIFELPVFLSYHWTPCFSCRCVCANAFQPQNKLPKTLSELCLRQCADSSLTKPRLSLLGRLPSFLLVYPAYEERKRVKILRIGKWEFVFVRPVRLCSGGCIRVRAVIQWEDWGRENGWVVFARSTPTRGWKTWLFCGLFWENGRFCWGVETLEDVLGFKMFVVWLLRELLFGVDVMALVRYLRGFYIASEKYQQTGRKQQNCHF